MTESPEHALGKIDGLWVVNSSTHTLDLPLKLAKQRISKRGESEFDSFDSYMEIRKSCWIIEKQDGQNFCECPVGMKVHIYYILSENTLLSNLLVWVTKKVNEKSHPRLEQLPYNIYE